MGLFKKKKKKTVYSVSTAAAPMFDLDKDLLNETIPKMVMQKIQTNQSAKDYILNYANGGASQLLSYYLNGQHSFLDKLPESNITSFGVSSEVIEDVIKKIENNDNIYFRSTSYGEPDDLNWIEHELQNNNNYNVLLGLLLLNNNYYSIEDYEYNEITDKFDVKLKTIYDIHVQTLLKTQVTTSAEKDNETGLYKQITTKTTIETIKGVEVENEIIISEKEISVVTTEEFVDDDNISNYVELDIIDEIITLNENNVITIPVNTYKDDYGYYFADYSIDDKNILWFYDPNTSKYPELTAKTTSYSYNSYPITLLRQNVFSVTEYDKDYKVVQSGNRPDTIYRPNNITKERFKDTEHITKSIGLNINTIIKEIEKNKDADKLQDAFIVVGLSPSNKSPIVSKGLYIMFDYLYKKLTPTKPNKNSSYRITIQELPYNAHLEWTPILPFVSKKVIGKKNEYKHEIKNIKHEFITSKFTRNAVQNHLFDDGTKGDAIIGYRRTYGFNKAKRYVTKYYKVYTRNNNRYVSIPYSVKDGEGKTVWFFSHTYKVLSINSGIAVLANYQTIELLTLELMHQVSDTEVRTIQIASKVQTKKSFLKRKYESTPSIWHNSISGYARGRYRSGSVSITLTSEDLVIPLPTFVATQLSYMEQVSLMGASLYTVFYAAQYDRITYYKSTGFGKAFGFIVVAVAIVINIITMGGSTPLTVAAVGLSVIESVGVALALTIALNLIADATNNPTIRMALSVVAMVVAAYASGGFNNFEMNFSTAVNLSTMPVKAFNIYVGAETELVMSKMASLENKFTAFMSQYENKSKQFENIIKNLSSGIDTEFLVKLSTDVNSSTTLYDNGTTWSPSFTRYMLIDSYKDFDLLYKNSIEGFVDKQLKVGLIDI